MSDPITYTIRTPADFASVPVDRLGACLDEFRMWLAIRITAAQALPGMACHGTDFLWIDDGKGEMTVSYQRQDGAEFHRETLSMASAP